MQNTGATFAFHHVGGVWSAPDLIEPSVLEPNLNTGRAIDATSDHLVMGTPVGSLVAPSGSSYIFRLQGLSWSEIGQLRPTYATQNGQFAATVSISGDLVLYGCVDGNGLNQATGSALVFSLAPYVPATYCTAKLNSLGCLPAISSQGSASATAPTAFTVSAQSILNNKYGLLFFGLSGRTAFPFQGGTLCVLPPIRRTITQNSSGSSTGNDCTGTYAFDFNALVQSGLYPDLTAGVLVDAQYWYRDPASPSTTGLTDGLEFGIGF
jgi:hypothetical protein